MPIYEYACVGCGHKFEMLVRGQETPECPECRQSQVEKQFSVPAAHTASGGSLPMAGPSGGGCGRPQCGQGFCAGMGGM